MRKRLANPEPSRRLPDSIRDQALRWLAQREYSRQELVRRLERQFPSEAVDLVVQQLALEGLQSDQRFSEALLADRTRRGYGPGRVLAELRQRGIDSAVAEQLLHDSQTDWQQVAQQQLGRHFRKPASDPAGKLQQSNHLLRRGFPAELVYRLLQTDDES